MKKTFLTEYEKDGKKFCGDNVEAESWAEAEFLAYPNKVVGILQMEITVHDN